MQGQGWPAVPGGDADVLDGPLQAPHALVAKALELVEESAYSDAELLAIDKYWDAVSRERTSLNAAERRGLERGRTEGLEKGRAEGAKQEKLANAKSMKALGLDASVIAEVTGLTVDEICAL